MIEVYSFAKFYGSNVAVKKKPKTYRYNNKKI